MPIYSDEPLAVTRKRLHDGMIAYMSDAGKDEKLDCGYTHEHVSRCSTILDRYLAALAPSPALQQDTVRAAVKSVVLELNELNDETEGRLIETDQREDLCQIILLAAARAGLDGEQDHTEEWREW